MPYIGRSVNYGNAVTEQFVGDGSADYTLAYETITDGVVVSLDGVVQVNGTDFNILGTVITFTSVVASPIDINIIYLGLTISIGTPSDSSITLAKMAANSVDSDQYVDGSIDLVHMSAESVDSDQYVDGSIDGEHLTAVMNSSLTSTGKALVLGF